MVRSDRGVRHRRTVSLSPELVAKLRKLVARDTYRGAAIALGTDDTTLHKILGVNQVLPATAARLAPRIEAAS